jgi:hypothetical protein
VSREEAEVTNAWSLIHDRGDDEDQDDEDERTGSMPATLPARRSRLV